MTIQELIDALEHVPEHLRDGTATVFDEQEVELHVVRVYTLASGSVVIDAEIGSIGIGTEAENETRYLSDLDIDDVRTLRKNFNQKSIVDEQ